MQSYKKFSTNPENSRKNLDTLISFWTWISLIAKFTKLIRIKQGSWKNFKIILFWVKFSSHHRSFSVKPSIGDASIKDFWICKIHIFVKKSQKYLVIWILIHIFALSKSKERAPAFKGWHALLLSCEDAMHVALSKSKSRYAHLLSC